MSDIFLSYAEEDREQARAVVVLLESAGWSVWWDRRIPAGRKWRDVLDEALEHMRCMVVLWSRHSVESDWVRDEAEEGRQRGTLVPVLLDGTLPPRGFRGIQAANFSGWRGDGEADVARQLVADLRSLLTPTPTPTETAEPWRVDLPPAASRLAVGQAATTSRAGRGPAVSRRGLWMLAGAGGILILGIMVVWWPASKSDTASAPRGLESVVVDKPSTTAAPAPAADTASPKPAEPPPVTPDAAAVAVAKPSPDQAGSPPPVKVAAPVPARRSAAPASAAVKRAPARCDDIALRLQLGEPLSAADAAFLKDECR